MWMKLLGLSTPSVGTITQLSLFDIVLGLIENEALALVVFTTRIKWCLFPALRWKEAIIQW